MVMLIPSPRAAIVESHSSASTIKPPTRRDRAAHPARALFRVRAGALGHVCHARAAGAAEGRVKGALQARGLIDLRVQGGRDSPCFRMRAVALLFQV